MGEYVGGHRTVTLARCNHRLQMQVVFSPAPNGGGEIMIAKWSVGNHRFQMEAVKSPPAIESGVCTVCSATEGDHAHVEYPLRTGQVMSLI